MAAGECGVLGVAGDVCSESLRGENDRHSEPSARESVKLRMTGDVGAASVDTFTGSGFGTAAGGDAAVSAPEEALGALGVRRGEAERGEPSLRHALLAPFDTDCSHEVRARAPPLRALSTAGATPRLPRPQSGLGGAFWRRSIGFSVIGEPPSTAERSCGLLRTRSVEVLSASSDGRSSPASIGIVTLSRAMICTTARSVVAW